jgi:hypothetical protein
MFKGMHPIFWVGIALIYGLAIIFWIIEIASDVGTVHTTILGIPAPFIYNNIFMVWILPLIIAWMWYYFPEKKKKEEDRRAGKEG